MAHRGKHDKPSPSFPSGTVTFLFTDVEGSTTLLAELGDSYPDVLAGHRRLLRAAVAAQQGSEVDTQGDAFLFAFARAGDALAAAAAAQAALADSGLPIRARMGVHTGEPHLGPEGYVGLDVHLGARICSAAHGGQVLVSATTQALAPHTGVRDVGEHRLKDFPDAVHLFQLGADPFPPPRALSVTNLPVVANRLVGRQAELERGRELLLREDVRLVTLTGPGGSGKSRLALELAAGCAHESAAGVRLVSLGSVSDPDAVPGAIAAALGIAESGIDAVVRHVRDLELLLLLDNVEHLLEAAPAIARLVEEAPHVTLLATSRLPLRLRGEHTLQLPPLDPDDATALFRERAHAAGGRVDDADAATVVEICRRLDGLPLAIELAAARTPLLSMPELLERLGLAILSDGPRDLPERQRTLRATIDWSYALLTPEQRELHAALAVFAGGCTLAGAAAVHGSDALHDLGALVESGLLRRDGERLRILVTVREYALGRLAAEGRLDDVRRRHAGHYASLAAEAESGLEGEAQTAWLGRLDAELDDVRAAIEHSLDAGDAGTALRIATRLGRFWRARGLAGEARRWLERGLTSDAEIPVEVQAKALWSAARQAMAQADIASAEKLLEQALLLLQDVGLRREQALCLAELGMVALERGDLDAGASRCERAVEIGRELADDRALSGALNTLAAVESERGEHAEARRLYAESLELRRRLANPMLVTNTIYGLGLAALVEGDLAAAHEALSECLQLARESNDVIHVAGALCSLGELALLEGDPETAQTRLLESLDLYGTLGNSRSAAECLHALGSAAAAAGRADDAARLRDEATALRGESPLLPLEIAVARRAGPPLYAAR